MRQLLLAGAGVLGLMLVAGCANKEDNTPTYLDIPPTETDTMGMQPLLNDAKLATTSPPVRAAFLHDFPNAGISTISMKVTTTGETLYRITFIQNGQADIVVYNDSGRIVEQPASLAPVPPGVRVP